MRLPRTHEGEQAAEYPHDQANRHRSRPLQQRTRANENAGTFQSDININRYGE
jgi:hypothetical protein